MKHAKDDRRRSLFLPVIAAPILGLASVAIAHVALHPESSVLHHGAVAALLTLAAIAIVILAVTSRRRSAEAERLAQHHTVFVDALRVAFWEYDADGDRFVHVSPNVEQIVGFAPEVWSDYRSWLGMIHPDDRERASEACALAIRNRERHTCEYRMGSDDRGWTWVREVSAPIVKPERRTVQGGVLVDITDLKRAEAHDRTASLVLEATAVVAGEFDADTGRFTFIAANADDVLGCEASAWKTIEDWLDCVHRDDRERVAAWARNVLEHETIHATIEYRLIRNDGRPFWVRETASMERNPEGTRIIRWVMLDIEELKQAQDQSRTAQLILESTPIVAGEYDPSIDRYTYVSPQAEQLLGPVVNEWTDFESWLATIHEDDAPAVRDWGFRIISRLGDPEPIEYRVRTSPGSYVWVRVVVAPVEKSGPDDVVMRWVLLDITDAKAAERAARHAERRAKESEELLTMAQNLASVGSWHADMRTGRVTWSEPLYRIFSRDLDDYQPTTEDILAQIHPRDRAAHDDWLGRLSTIETAHDEPLECRVVPPDWDGDPRRVKAARVHARAEFGPDGTATRLYGSVQDITNLRNIEQQQRRDALMLDAVLESTPSFLRRIDRDGTVVESHGRALKRLGYDDAETTGENLLRRFPELKPVFERVRKGKRVSYVHSGTTDAQPWHFAIHAFPDPETSGTAGFAFDITEQIETQKSLERALRTQRLLLSELDHRVKNALGGLLTLIELSTERVSTPEQLAESIASRIRCMAAVHGLLGSTHWEPIDFRRLVDEVVGNVAQEKLRTDGPAVTIPAHQATPLAMVLNEWANNASKYGALKHDDGRLTVSWDAVPIDDRPADNGDQQPLRLRILWLEEDGPEIHKQPQRGLGMQLVEGFARFELQGEVHHVFEPQGVKHQITATLAPPQRRASAIETEPTLASLAASDSSHRTNGDSTHTNGDSRDSADPAGSVRILESVSRKHAQPD